MFLVGVLKAGRLLGLRSEVMVQQRAGYIQGKPPKDKIGPVQTVFVLGVMSLTVLGPSGWILSHLEEYKSRD